MSSDEKGAVIVEFFGPFRKFGNSLELPLAGVLSYDALVDELAECLGEPFRERAARKNTTVILNNRILERKRLTGLRIAPGDRVAFALLMGGG